MAQLMEKLSDKLTPILTSKLPPPPGRSLEETENNKDPGMQRCAWEQRAWFGSEWGRRPSGFGFSLIRKKGCKRKPYPGVRLPQAKDVWVGHCVSEGVKV